MNVLKKIKAYLCYYEAVKKADEAHKKTGKRFYVMPTSGKKKTLLIMDRFNFRKLRHKGYIDKKFFVSDVERECFYATPYKNGCSKLAASVIEYKKKQFYFWYSH